MERLPSDTNPSTDLESGPGTSFANNRESSLSSGHGDDNDDLRIEQISSKDSGVDPSPPSDWGASVLFQSYYPEALNRPHSDISWVGSVQNILFFVIGTLSGRATDAGYFKALNATRGLIFPGIIQTLLPRIGYAWAVRVLGFFTLATLTPCFIFLRQRVPRTILRLGCLQGDPVFSICSCHVPQFLGPLCCLLLYQKLWSQCDRSLQREVNDLLLIMNGVGVAGRLLLNFYIRLLYGVRISDISSWYAFAILNGYFASGLQSLFLATLSSMSPDLKKPGIRFGIILSIASLASMTGPPTSGALIHLKNGEYLYAQIFSGASMAVVAVVLICARISVTGLVMKIKI
ncbi:hypothetical protein PABG_05632 [Paracoccidioides brasiliensis Pb03]|nr:hypothetical protein PABG_05632 [Paracoccidioides brasiliensis Pb03]